MASSPFQFNTTAKKRELFTTVSPVPQLESRLYSCSELDIWILCRTLLYSFIPPCKWVPTVFQTLCWAQRGEPGMELPSANKTFSITNKRELVSMISTLSERDLVLLTTPNRGIWASQEGSLRIEGDWSLFQVGVKGPEVEARQAYKKCTLQEMAIVLVAGKK